LRHIYHRIGFTLSGFKVLDESCNITQAAFLTAVVLRNTSTRQVLFYQLRLAVGRSRAGLLTWALPPQTWFFRGTNVQSGESRQFGFDDDVTSYGERPLTMGTDRIYNFDLLPRLTDLIGDGAKFGIDQDFSHWVLSGTYHGSNLWGHLTVASDWSGFSLSID
jgi:hypothetical protein